MINLNNITPRNATEARRLTNTIDRAHNIIAEGYTFTNMPVNQVAVSKPGTQVAAYWIDLDATNSTHGCSCPDFAKHGNYCKHTLAVNLIAAQEADEEAEMMYLYELNGGDERYAY